MKNKTQVTILNDSIADQNRITTFLIEGFPKCLVGEIAKHRLVTMNCQSSRAMTVNATINQIKSDPYIPTWTVNQKGMSGSLMVGWRLKLANKLWILTSRLAILATQVIALTTRAHKQNLNRLLEPWMKVSLILTATEWGNFFKLRCSPDCQNDFRSVAIEMRNLQMINYPNLIRNGEWHLPYPSLTIQENVAKVASVSYSNHNKDRDPKDAERLFNQLHLNGHWTAFEHCAQAVIPGDSLDSGNSIDLGVQVFDIFQLDISVASYNIDENEGINTGSFKGWMPLRRFLENDLPVRRLIDKNKEASYNKV